MSVDALLERLAAVERRLAEHAERRAPSGQTDPDPGGTERWEAGQVWAHLAEFPGYWLEQVQHVLEAQRTGTAQPVPFGRTRSDPGRIAAIERDRRARPDLLLGRVRTGIVAARRFLLTAARESLALRGAHPTLGEMTVERIIEHFVAEHLEEHAAQLDGLVAAAKAEAPGQPGEAQDVGDR